MFSPSFTTGSQMLCFSHSPHPTFFASDPASNVSAYHFNPRPSPSPQSSTIVQNHFINGAWGKEVYLCPGSCLFDKTHQNSHCIIIFEITQDGFAVHSLGGQRLFNNDNDNTWNGGSGGPLASQIPLSVTFTHRVPLNEIHHLNLNYSHPILPFLNPAMLQVFYPPWLFSGLL